MCCRPTLSWKPRRDAQHFAWPICSSFEKAMKRLRQVIREWNLPGQTFVSLNELARQYSRHMRGWMNYYSHFYKSALYRLYDHVDQKLVRWAQRKYRKLAGKTTRAQAWLKKVSAGGQHTLVTRQGPDPIVLVPIARKLIPQPPAVRKRIGATAGHTDRIRPWPTLSTSRDHSTSHGHSR
jgi:Group II intron, maturase-specific domain